MITDLQTILKNKDIRLKQWIYDNPTVRETQDFLNDCPFAHLIGKSRYCDVRGKLIDALSHEEQKKFGRRSTYGKNNSDTSRVKHWIINHRRLCHTAFRNHFKLSGSPEQIAFSLRITERKFKDTKRKMIKRGEIESAREVNQSLFDSFNCNVD